MSTTTMTATGTATEVTLERVTFWLLLGFVAALQMSIAAANVLLAMTFVCWVALLVRDRTWWSAPARRSFISTFNASLTASQRVISGMGGGSWAGGLPYSAPAGKSSFCWYSLYQPFREFFVG